MSGNIDYTLESLAMEARQLISFQSTIVDAVLYSPTAPKEYLGALQYMEKSLQQHSDRLDRVLGNTSN